MLRISAGPGTERGGQEQNSRTARRFGPQIEKAPPTVRAIEGVNADEVIIPEYEGGLMTGRMIEKYYPVQTNLK